MRIVTVKKKKLTKVNRLATESPPATKNRGLNRKQGSFTRIPKIDEPEKALLKAKISDQLKQLNDL